MHRHNWQPLEPGKVRCKICYKVSEFVNKCRDKVTSRKMRPPEDDVEEMKYHPVPGIRQVTWKELEEIVCQK